MYILAIDQGTTNSRAIIFDENGMVISKHEITLKQSFPKPGWVEQDAEEMFENSVICCQQAIKNANLLAKDIIAIGITNQRETTIIWDKSTGKTVYPAIVWQDRRTHDICSNIASPKLLQYIREHTGLLLDPYFSATKIMWILDNVPHARERADKGELLFGTVDTYLLWRLTHGKNHATDITNASRTMLFNIKTQTWDDHLLATFNIPKNLLPVVLDNTALYGELDKAILNHPIPITGIAGDQQAATIGQACFKKGMVKSTYGTGCFMLLNTGSDIVYSKNRLLATIAYRINNEVVYGLEGSIFCAGVTIKWLRDTLQLIKTAAESEELANSISSTDGVYLIPAFTGLGAPHWDPNARAAIMGLTRNSNRAHIVRAALESVVYQSADLLSAMQSDFNGNLNELRVDGGMVANNWLLQFLADMLDVKVQRPACIDTTALGVAYLAGLQVGVYQSLDTIASHWQQNAAFMPKIDRSQRELMYSGWQENIKRVLSDR